MNPARPLLLVVLLITVVIPTVASDQAAQPQTSSGAVNNSVANALAYAASFEVLRRPAGLTLLEAHPTTMNHPPVARRPLAKLDDGTCYTMRIYKVRRTESLSDGESALKGYSTCEWATNYQIRTAIAHPGTADESRLTDSRK